MISILLTSNMNKPLSALLEKVMPTPAKPASGLALIDEYKMVTEVFQSYHEREKSMQFVISHSSRTVREHYLHALLRGQSLEDSVSSDMIKEIGEEVAGPFFGVLVFKINELEPAGERVEGNSSLCCASHLGISPKSCWSISAPAMFLLWEETKLPPSFNTRKISCRRNWCLPCVMFRAS